MTVLNPMMGLLIHENTDIALAIVNIISELLDEDAVSDNTDEAKILVEGMVCHSRSQDDKPLVHRT